jgi:hypothetical protein
MGDKSILDNAWEWEANGSGVIFLFSDGLCHWWRVSYQIGLLGFWSKCIEREQGGRVWTALISFRAGDVDRLL